MTRRRNTEAQAIHQAAIEDGAVEAGFAVSATIPTSTNTRQGMLRQAAEAAAARIAAPRADHAAGLAAGAAEVAALVNAGMAFNLNDFAGVPVSSSRQTPDKRKFAENAVVTFVGKAGRSGSKRTYVALGMTVAQLRELGYKDHDLRWETRHGVLGIA